MTETWRNGKRVIVGIIVACLSFTTAGAAETGAHAPSWPDNFASRLEALALLQTLNAELLSHDSATLTLDRWCARHHLAADPHVVARLIRHEEKTPSREQLHLLDVGSPAEVRYRRVQLTCGRNVLSEADNWYVPARLSAGMNKQLDETDIAFGRAVQALHFRRRTLSATLLWHPLPNGWEMGTAMAKSDTDILHIPYRLLEHRAVLTLPDGTPFSLVVETYTSGVLAFPPPK